MLPLPCGKVSLCHPIPQRQNNDKNLGTILEEQEIDVALTKPLISPTFILPSSKKRTAILGEGKGHFGGLKDWAGVAFCPSEV